MADRGRDLKIGIIADTSKADFDDVADNLEHLSDAAADVGEDLGRTRQELGEFLTKLGKIEGEAKQAAQELDDIGDAARKMGKDVDAGADKARKGLDTFKDEARQSGRETAASFGGGFDDVADFVQETAANAFADMGKFGAAAGVAAAVGLGVLVSKIQEAQQRMSELRQLFFDLAKDDGGGGLKGRIKEIADELGPDRLADIKDALSTTKISAEEFFKALAGDPDAARRIKEQTDALIPAFNAPWDTTANEAQHLSHILAEYAQSGQDAAKATGLYKDVVQGAGDSSASAAPQVLTLADAVSSVADQKHTEALAGIAGGLRDVADASSEISEAVAEEGQVSIGTLTKLLNEQTEAAKKHQANVAAALKDGGDEFAAWVAEQGPEVSQAYAKGSAKERAALRKAFQSNVGAAMGEGVAKGLLQSTGSVTDAAGNVFTVAKNKLTGATIYIPTGIKPPSQGALNRINAQIKQGIGAIYVEAIMRTPSGRRID